MNEFSLIKHYFKSILHHRDDVVIGIGDDAACLRVQTGHELLVSCDTLLAEVHFLSSWDAYDIAYRAVMVNVSDIAAMGATPCWVMLALTLPAINEPWLQRFSQGLRDALQRFNIALIGGDTTRGPLSLTLTIHGMAPEGQVLQRCGAQPGHRIYVSGELGGAALAVTFLARQDIDVNHQKILKKKLLHPQPRVDLVPTLRAFASAAIDISDGLSADLQHICESSQVGACLYPDSIPLHPLVKKYQGVNALDFALSGGDDYELCFTVPADKESQLLASFAKVGVRCFPIGVIEERPGLRLKKVNGDCLELVPRGYSHF